MSAQGTLKAAAAAFAFAAVAGGPAADSVRPASELNTQCLLYHGNGCNTIEDEHTCTNSRDGRFLDYLEGRKIRGQPCIWCSEGGCSGDGTPKCEPYQFMIGNLVRPPPAVWVAANCTDGRDRQESINRSPGYSTEMGDGRSPAPGGWAPVGGGEGQACRGKSTLDRGSREADQWSYAMWTAVSFEQCKSFCVENCQGVEYKASEDYCEVWYDRIHYSEPVPGHQCYKKAAAASRSLGLIKLPDTTDVVLKTPVTPNNRRCLRFLHIPKTGGTTIEEAMQRARRADPKNHTLRGWGLYDELLHCTHQVPDKDRWRKVCALGSASPGEKCNVYHTPPRHDPKVAEGYGGCDTFCVVRHPINRIVSEWQYKTGESCDGGKFEKFLLEGLHNRSANKFNDDCHWLPQTDFVFRIDENTGLPIRTCEHILKYEHLHDEFPKLMAAYGLSVSLTGIESLKHAPCNFEISNPFLFAIRAAFAEDFGAFDYE